MLGVMRCGKPVISGIAILAVAILTVPMLVGYALCPLNSMARLEVVKVEESPAWSRADWNSYLASIGQKERSLGENEWFLTNDHWCVTFEFKNLTRARLRLAPEKTKVSARMRSGWVPVKGDDWSAYELAPRQGMKFEIDVPREIDSCRLMLEFSPESFRDRIEGFLRWGPLHQWLPKQCDWMADRTPKRHRHLETEVLLPKPDVKYSELQPEVAATLSLIGVTIHAGETEPPPPVDIFRSVTADPAGFTPPHWSICVRARVVGRTVYVSGCRTLRNERGQYEVFLPASSNSQPVSVVWVDPDGSQVSVPIRK
jgi:hypothetical protein